MATTPTDVYYAPDRAAFDALVSDAEATHCDCLLVAATTVDGREVPFLLTLTQGRLCLVFAEDLSQRLDADTLGELVQAVVSYHRGLLERADPGLA
ncbi:MAG: hypothetical protein ACOCYN_01735 [Planctomycetota bacterium]